jgi:hypothetical protein
MSYKLQRGVGDVDRDVPCTPDARKQVENARTDGRADRQATFATDIWNNLSSNHARAMSTVEPDIPGDLPELERRVSTINPTRWQAVGGRSILNSGITTTNCSSLGKANVYHLFTEEDLQQRFSKAKLTCLNHRPA